MDGTVKQKAFDEHQEAICELCEDEIIHGQSMTCTFLCEGRFCDEALAMYLAREEQNVG